VDLILVTHSHRDHFAPELVLRNVAGNPATVLAAPPQAIEKLREIAPDFEKYSDRVKELDIELFDSTELVVEGIRIQAHRIRHSEYMVTDEKTGKQYNRHENVENLAYVIEIGNVRLLHVGDAILPLNREYLESERFPQEKMDIVFLEFFDWSDETTGILERRLKPEHVVFMHLPPQEEKIESLTRHLTESFPNAVIFRKPLEARSF
jgi:L-ascorbate metabolism protein UlaG (beta-lactamase superfamily)